MDALTATVAAPETLPDGPTGTPRLARIVRRDAVRIGVTVAAAAVLSLISAPMNLHELHWVAYVPFLWVLREDTPRENRAYAWLYAMVATGTIFRWIVGTIVTFSNLPLPVAVLALVLFSLVFGAPLVLLWMAVHPMRRRLGLAWIVAVPAWQVCLEWLSMHVVLFPFSHGISQFGFPYTWQLASVTGVWGLTWLVLFVNCALGEAVYRRREGRAFPVGPVAAAAALLGAVCVWGAWRYQRMEALLAAAPVLRVNLIQTAAPMEHVFSEGRHAMLQTWVDQTEATIAASRPGDVDLVVWSEGASPGNVHEGAVKLLIERLVRKGRFELLVGGGTHGYSVDPTSGKRVFEDYNSVYLFGRDGGIRGRYDKVVPLPFGEYLPLSQTFPFLNDWIEGPGDFRAGADTVVLDGEAVRIAAPICYEAILPGLCRRFDDPDLFVNVTNDAWFGDTAAPYQHAMLAAARATELGRPLVREGYTGVSMVVEPHGRIDALMPPFRSANDVVEVRLGRVETIYARLGDWFVGACAFGLVAAGLGVRRRAQP